MDNVGSEKNRSTSHALIDLIEEITTHLDKGRFTIGVFIDLKKAFDTINHEILLKKMERYGIRGTVLSWLRSYLADRKQSVQVGNYIS